MKRIVYSLQVTAVVAILAAFGATQLQAKAEYTKKEGKACTVCHVKTGSKDLNDVGKCYEKSKTIKGCEAPKAK
jgi:cytochrome c553